MTENTQKPAAPIDADEALITRAREIKDKTGCTLIEAMALAQEEVFNALDAAALPDSFTITLEVKPRVARWILANFGGHRDFTIEQRLAAFLVQTINRVRVQAIRRSEPAPEIPKNSNEAVTLRREHMAAINGG